MKVERLSLLVRQLKVLHLLALAQSGARLGHGFLPGSFLFPIVPKQVCRYSETRFRSTKYGVAKASLPPLMLVGYGLRLGMVPCFRVRVRKFTARSRKFTRKLFPGSLREPLEPETEFPRIRLLGHTVNKTGLPYPLGVGYFVRD